MKMEAIKNRYEFVIFFDVENGNPNGDPDAGNMPRIDPETQNGIVTDVCLKRKIRNFVDIAKSEEPGYCILINPDKALNEKFGDAYDALELKRKDKGKNASNVRAAREYICANYYDVRTFGAVMSTGDDPCGIVRGPVQINFAKSLDPIFAQEVTITRQAITTVDKSKEAATEMGKKNIVPYALYRAEGYVSALLAQKTGFSDYDLELLWTAIINMFEHDHSAARGKMCLRKLIVFKHSDMLGNCPSHILFDKITAAKKEDVLFPRSFDNYEIRIDREMPDGVELIEKL